MVEDNLYYSLRTQGSDVSVS